MPDRQKNTQRIHNEFPFSCCYYIEKNFKCSTKEERRRSARTEVWATPCKRYQITVHESYADSTISVCWRSAHPK